MCVLAVSHTLTLDVGCIHNKDLKALHEQSLLKVDIECNVLEHALSHDAYPLCLEQLIKSASQLADEKMKNWKKRFDGLS